MHARRRICNLHAGFTLVELVIVVVLLAVLSVYVAIRGVSPAEATLPSQAEQLARDIRHLQVLAATKGQHLRVNTTASGYSVTCIEAEGPIACDASASLSVTLKDAVLAGPSPPLDFDSLGRPLENGSVRTTPSTYTLSAGTASMAVRVSPISGFVAVASL